MADIWTGKLDPYLDGELPSDEMSALDIHVRACPDCAADVLNRLQLKRTVQIAGRRYSPTADLRQRIQKMSAVRRQQTSWRWLPLAATVVALLIAGLFVRQWNRRNLEHRVFSEVTDLHVSTLASTTPVDVMSTDRHTVKPWFEGKIPFTFNLPELKNSEFSLIGGRVTYLRQTPGAHLIYRIRKHQISVFIFPESAAQELPAESGIRKDATFDVESWSQAGLRYFVVSDATGEDVNELVRMLKNAS